MGGLCERQSLGVPGAGRDVHRHLGAVRERRLRVEHEDGVRSSAQWTEPATDFPPTEIENARAVLARSIDCVKRTDSTASRAILVLFATGRKRTTDGAVVVWTAHGRLLERETVGVADAGDDEPVVDVGAERGRGHELEAGQALEPGDRADGAGGRRVEADRALDRLEVDRPAEADEERRVQRDARSELGGRGDRGAGRCPGHEDRPRWPRERLTRAGQGARLDRHGVEGRDRPVTAGRDRQDHARAVPREVDGLGGLHLERCGDGRTVHRRGEGDRHGPGQVSIGRERRGERRLAQRADRIGVGRDGCRRLTGTQDPDTEDERQADCEADPGEGRASHDCADAGRTGDGDGQQRNGGLTQ